MSLNEPRHRDLILKQLRFKLNANAGSFTVFVILQLFALLFSFPSESSSHFFNEQSSITLLTVSGSVHTVFLFLWALFSGASLGNHQKWDEAFAFVTTRPIHHLSNLYYMIMASVMTGFAVSLISPALRLLTHLRYGEVDVLTSTITEAPSQFFLQLITAISYAFLFFMIGYAIGSYAQTGKTYGGMIIMLFLGFIFFMTFILGMQAVVAILIFFTQETFLLFFLMKIISTSAILFAFSIFTTSRIEVRHS